MPSSWVPGVFDTLGVGVGEGNADNGSGMHPTIGELKSPSLTATTIPATNSKRKIQWTRVTKYSCNLLNTHVIY